MRKLGLASVSLAIVSIFLITSGCSHGGSTSHQTAGMGTLKVHLIDAPIDLSNVQSVNVTLTGVIVYPDDAEGTISTPEPGQDMENESEAAPITIMNHPQTFDLLTLTGGASVLLASGELPAGEYSRIRLEISAAEIVYKDGSTAPLQIESNKVDIPIEFKVTVNADMSITLDFNAAASVQVNDTGTGTLILRPVITGKESD